MLRFFARKRETPCHSVGLWSLRRSRYCARSRAPAASRSPARTAATGRRWCSSTASRPRAATSCRARVCWRGGDTGWSRTTPAGTEPPPPRPPTPIPTWWRTWRPCSSDRGLEHAALVGSSMGAATAMAFALAHPERVSALVQITPAFGGRGRRRRALGPPGRRARVRRRGRVRGGKRPDSLPERWREPVRRAVAAADGAPRASRGGGGGAARGAALDRLGAAAWRRSSGSTCPRSWSGPATTPIPRTRWSWRRSTPAGCPGRGWWWRTRARRRWRGRAAGCRRRSPSFWRSL